MLLPFLLIIVVLIFLLDRHNPFFVQQRVGRGGRLFPLYKFRTMKTGLATKEHGFDAGKTSRITPLGRFLRNTKLDELLQLFNVLKGDMSLVGPRPEVKKWTLVYPEKWEIVHRVKPGITDNASILFRREEEILAKTVSPENTYREVILPQKLKLSIDYINNRTFWEDIKILLKTIKSVYTD